ncbi:Major facilitator superfamily domain containing protein [Naviculisporaceae sp. PSN 640]
MEKRVADEEIAVAIPSVSSHTTLASTESTIVCGTDLSQSQTQTFFTVVSFEPDDPTNPHNWSTLKKTLIVITCSLICTNSSLGSALAANITPFMGEFNIPLGPQTILPTSVYLGGFMCGPLIFAPLSEFYGRSPILIIGFTFFTLATLGTALAPSWPAFLVFRFLTGVFGAPPISVGGGVVADMFDEEVLRGRIMMLWGASTFMGPLGAPIITGFTAGTIGWRWPFWIAFILASVSFVTVVLLPETLSFTILRRKAEALNKQSTNDTTFISPGDLNRGSLAETLKITLSRPIYLLFTEMLLAFSCIYMAFAYAVFYMMLKIFVFIFQGTYHFSMGLSGVAFCIVGLGTITACLANIWYDTVAPDVASRHPKRRPEYFRLPPACVAGPLLVLSLLWLGWASRESVHWIVPLLSMIPYGFGYQMIFNSMLNYLTDAYRVYAASALAACGTTRSLAGVVIPLCIDNMLDSLGVAWSCTILGLISAVLSIVPFLFIAYGEKIRAGSRFSSAMRTGAGGPPAGELTRTISAT